MKSSLTAGACSAPVFFLGKPCVRCKKHWDCCFPCVAFELYLTMKSPRLIRVSCSKEHCPLKSFKKGPCLLYCDGNCLAYRYAERVVR